MTQFGLSALLLSTFLSIAACRSNPTTSRASASTDGGAVMSQINHGAEIYGQYCAGCHGDSGQGTRSGPPLVGEGALPLRRNEARVRTSEFRTALDIATFATQNMPPSAEERAELKTADYWAVLAFALSANGIELTEPIGPENAESFVLHPE